MGFQRIRTKCLQCDLFKHISYANTTHKTNKKIDLFCSRCMKVTKNRIVRVINYKELGEY